MSGASWLLFVLLGAALLGLLACHIWLVILAFQRSMAWGLCVLFVPLGALAFAVSHWEEASRPFLAEVLTGMLVVMSVITMTVQQVQAERERRAASRTEQRVAMDEAGHGAAPTTEGAGIAPTFAGALPAIAPRSVAGTCNAGYRELDGYCIHGTTAARMSEDEQRAWIDAYRRGAAPPIVGIDPAR